MSITILDHVNIRTNNLEGMISFYDEVLGLSPGPRPNFPFPGAWLYAGDQAVVHLIAVDPETVKPEPAIQLEHFAFAARNMAAFTAKLEKMGVPYRLGHVEDFGITQVNIHDEDGNRLHIDFRGE